MLFYFTRKDPEKAHDLLVNASKFLRKTSLDNLLLRYSHDKKNPQIEISNAAGFNKNGEIHPQFLRYLGFDRVVVGTVTAESWSGNPRPRIKRYVKKESLVNWMGLPGEGVDRVAENLSAHGSHEVPLTINLASTPGKTGNYLLKDLEKTITILKYLPYIDRFELNISCPNIADKNYYLIDLKDIIKCANENKSSQELYIKISPNLGISEIENICEACMEFGARGVTISNTTELIYSYGGTSGNELYSSSLETQKLFYNFLTKNNLDLDIIACGGINSLERLAERKKYGANKIQVYTPLIFKGPKLLRELKIA